MPAMTPNINAQSRAAYAAAGTLLLVMAWLVPFADPVDRNILLLSGSLGMLSAASGFCLFCWVAGWSDGP